RVGVISRGRLLAESTVADLRGQASLLIRADPLATAREVATREVGAERVAFSDGSLRLSIDSERTDALVRALVGAGVKVREVRPLERNLEDVFFELTGEREEAPS